VSLVGLVLALIFPDGDQQLLAVIATTVVGMGSLALTNIGRFVQAREQIRQQGRIEETSIVHAPIEEEHGPSEALTPDLQRLRALLASGTAFDVKVEAGSIRQSAQTPGKVAASAADAEIPLAADTPGIDPEYDGRDGTLESRLALEQREACR
jgi:hypothetical protein